MLTLASLLGVGAGTAETVLKSWLGNPANVHWTLSLGVFLGPMALFCVAAANLTQRWRPLVVTSVAFAVGYAIATAIGDSLLSPYDRGISLLSLGVLPQNLLFVAIVSLLAAGLALLVRWLSRFSGMLLLEQDGSYCWRCAYQLGSEILTRCPECGTAREPTRFRAGRLYHWVARGRRHARRAGIAAILALILAASAVMHATGTIAAHRFARRFSSREMPLAGHVLDPAAPPSADYLPCPGAWLSLDDAAGLGLMISYLPRERAGVNPMRLELSTLKQSGDTRWFQPASPNVVCELDRTQAEHAIEHGLPAALLVEFKNASSTPARTGGTITRDGRPIIVIPAHPYFP